MSGSSPVTVGLIGCGRFGAILARRYFPFVPELRLTAVSDSNQQAAQELGAQLGLPVYANADDLLEHADCEAVLIATPTFTHRDLVVAAAAHGKHIFCEKPMALNAAECRAMGAAAERAGVKLMVGHKRRLRTPYADVLRLVQSGRLGAPIAMNLTCLFGRRWEGWSTQTRYNGGFLHLVAVHDINFMHAVCGPVGKVHAINSRKTHDDSDYPDAMLLTLRFANGAVGSLQAGFTFPVVTFHRAAGYQIICERGGIAWDPQRTVVEHQADGGERVAMTYEDRGFDQAYSAELTNFARWVRGQEEPLLTWHDGLHTVEIMEAAYRSAETGETVRLPLAEETD